MCFISASLYWQFKIFDLFSLIANVKHKYGRSNTLYWKSDVKILLYSYFKKVSSLDRE